VSVAKCNNPGKYQVFGEKIAMKIVGRSSRKG
jgi:hypothetical protein